MPPAAFLALLAIAMLVLAGIRLELHFRRGSARAPGPESPAARPELRASPAGGYSQRPLTAPALREAGQARRAGFAL